MPNEQGVSVGLRHTLATDELQACSESNTLLLPRESGSGFPNVEALTWKRYGSGNRSRAQQPTLVAGVVILLAIFH
jgi:hypothetical protein